jgi:hypothetical protein
MVSVGNQSDCSLRPVETNNTEIIPRNIRCRNANTNVFFVVVVVAELDHRNERIRINSTWCTTYGHLSSVNVFKEISIV